MFGKLGLKTRGDLLNTKRDEQRLLFQIYIKEELQECQGSCDLGVVLGAAGLAERLELITHDEYLKIHKDAYERHSAFLKAKKEADIQRAAERKAERTAKAKVVKEG